MNADASSDNPVLQDRFGRTIDYVRLSVTDRCDFRCVYCMAEDMTFVPRAQVLTLEEMGRLARVLVQLGVKRIRLTGGEPLVRRDVARLVRDIGAIDGLRELNMTTNGAGLPRHAQALKAAGVDRLNISLDSLDPERFRALTRTGDLQQVIAGIDAARAAGFERIKLNSVIMRGRNQDEVPALVDFALARGLDIAFIEEMPLGQITEHDRELAFVSSAELREQLSARLGLVPLQKKPGGHRAIGRCRAVAAASALFRPIHKIFAICVIGCGSPPRGVCFCAWAMSTAWICARCCAPTRMTIPPFAKPLWMPWPSSPSATTSTWVRVNNWYDS